MCVKFYLFFWNICAHFTGQGVWKMDGMDESIYVLLGMCFFFFFKRQKMLSMIIVKIINLNDILYNICEKKHISGSLLMELSGYTTKKLENQFSLSALCTMLHIKTIFIYVHKTTQIFIVIRSSDDEPQNIIYH